MTTKKKNKESLIKQVIPQLKLRNIWLLESRFERPNTPDPEAREFYQQDKRGAHFQTGNIVEDDRDVTLLHICVSLGSRVIDRSEVDESGEEPVVYFYIEADFMVEYELKDAVDQEALKAFADFNAVHNVWPFWRQHVYDIVSRGQVPRLDVPLFAGDTE